MKLSYDEFTEVAFIFERENGRNHSEYENEIINNSKFKNISEKELEFEIVMGIENGIYENDFERVSAYWALSKRDNKKLIPLLKKWLKKEIEKQNNIAIFEILVALDLLNEPSFAKERTGRDSNEKELNIRDALNYLK